MSQEIKEFANELSPKVLINEVQYQSNSIVSKQIIKKANGNITLFAFDKDESLTEHTSPYEAVVYIVDGEMEIRIAGNPVSVKTGEIIVLPPNVPHSLIAVRQSKMLLIMIK